MIDRVPSIAIAEKRPFSIMGYKPLNYKEGEHEVYLQGIINFTFPDDFDLSFRNVKEFEPKTAKDRGLYIDFQERADFEQQIYDDLYKIVRYNQWERQFHKLVIELSDLEHDLLKKESAKRKRNILYSKERRYTYNQIITELIIHEHRIFKSV
jgi:hypothetical protein